MQIMVLPMEPSLQPPAPPPPPQGFGGDTDPAHTHAHTHTHTHTHTLKPPIPMPRAVRSSSSRRISWGSSPAAPLLGEAATAPQEGFRRLHSPSPPPPPRWMVLGSRHKKRSGNLKKCALEGKKRRVPSECEEFCNALCLLPPCSVQRHARRHMFSRQLHRCFVAGGPLIGRAHYGRAGRDLRRLCLD